jgi:hypothetical protein
MSGFTKIAVTVPTTIYREVERARARLGKSRSATVAEALGEWLRGLQVHEADRRYIEAYLRQPENLPEIEAMTAVSTSHWDRWEPGEPSRSVEPRTTRRRKPR